MSAGLKVAQGQLREIVRDLEAIKLRLVGVEATLPPSSTEIDRLEDVGTGETDLVAELHSVIQCVLNDSLQPAIGDLRGMTDRTVPEPQERDG